MRLCISIRLCFECFAYKQKKLKIESSREIATFQMANEKLFNNQFQFNNNFNNIEREHSKER